MDENRKKTQKLPKFSIFYGIKNPPKKYFSNFGEINLVLPKYHFSDILKHFWPFEDIFCDFLNSNLADLAPYICIRGRFYVLIGNIRQIIYSRITLFTGWLTTRFERNFKTYIIYNTGMSLVRKRTDRSRNRSRWPNVRERLFFLQTKTNKKKNQEFKFWLKWVKALNKAHILSL